MRVISNTRWTPTGRARARAGGRTPSSRSRRSRSRAGRASRGIQAAQVERDDVDVRLVGEALELGLEIAGGVQVELAAQGHERDRPRTPSRTRTSTSRASLNRAARWGGWEMARLRRADCSGPGITRRRAGRGFAYYDDEGERVDEPEVLERIRELGIPPAWQDVWICPYPNGHLQATGIDAAGRKQYRYHDAWRTRRDAEKFDDMTRFAARCRGCANRSRPISPLGPAHPRARAGLRRAAARPRVLPHRQRGVHGVLRAGDDPQGARAGSTTGTMVFDFPAKSGKQRVQAVIDPLAKDIVCTLKRRRGGGPELLAYKAGRALVRPALGRHQRLPEVDHRRRLLAPRTSGPGARPCSPPSRSRSPGPRRVADVAQARDHPRDQGDRALPRQHAGGVPRVLHRPADLRRLPGRARARPRGDRGAPAPSRASCRRTTRKIELAVLDLLNETEDVAAAWSSSPALVRVVVRRRDVRAVGLRRQDRPAAASSRSGVGSAGTVGSSGTAGVTGSGGTAGVAGSWGCGTSSTALMRPPSSRSRRRRASPARSG